MHIAQAAPNIIQHNRVKWIRIKIIQIRIQFQEKSKTNYNHSTLARSLS